jgi:Protein of unknown function (DUF4058)
MFGHYALNTYGPELDGPGADAVPCWSWMIGENPCRRHFPVWIHVPLIAPDPDVALDLGAAVASVYERGAYAQQIDYRQSPPAPSLPSAEAE